MAFQFFRVPDSIQSNTKPPKQTHRWRASGSSSRGYVEAYAIGATPSVVASIQGTLYRQDLMLRQTAYNQWDIEVPYAKNKEEVGKYDWDFDTTGGNVHVKVAKEEVARFPAAEAPDQKGAIDVQDGDVKGADVTIPAMKINVVFKHPTGVLTMPRARFLASITGTTNADPFLGWAPGEVLFLGARGRDGSDSEASVTYQFAMSPNATGLTIGDITGIVKKGWEFVWTSFENAEETADDGKVRGIRKPKFVYVDRLYESIPMAASLGFGATA